MMFILLVCLCSRIHVFGSLDRDASLDLCGITYKQTHGFLLIELLIAHSC